MGITGDDKVTLLNYISGPLLGLYTYTSYCFSKKVV